MGQKEKTILMRHILFFFVLVLILSSCSADDDTVIEMVEEEQLYFPPNNSVGWDTSSLESLNWNKAVWEDLCEYLVTNNTRAFLILKEGKVVVEKYWGKNILGTADFTKDTRWYWASAGKTLTAFLVGLAQEEGFLNINDPTSDHLGNDWTSLSKEKQNLITIKHQLSMTTGLDYQVPDLNCTTPSCLQYKADAATQWFYHNAPYTLLTDVLENATGQSLDDYTDQKIEVAIGMNGDWIKNGFNDVYWSTARDAARFGLLILNKGKWKETVLMEDASYFEAMVNSSQNLNPSYGYLWWLNGKGKAIYPGLPTTFNVDLAPNAPMDLFAAMGKNGQIIDVVPSQNIVVVRMGEAPDDALVPIQFHNEIWAKLALLMAL